MKKWDWYSRNDHYMEPHNANSNTAVQSLLMILFLSDIYFQRVSKSLGPWFWGKYFQLEDFRRWELRSNSKRWDVRHNYSRGECSRSQSCTKSRMDTHCGQLINKGVAFYMSDVAFRNENWPTFFADCVWLGLELFCHSPRCVCQTTADRVRLLRGRGFGLVADGATSANWTSSKWAITRHRVGLGHSSRLRTCWVACRSIF